MNDDIALLLSRQVRAQEPPFTLDPTEALIRGQRMRTTRRRRQVAVSVVSAVAVVTGVVITVSALDLHTQPESLAAPAPTDYNAEQMPKVLQQVAREGFGAGLEGLSEEFVAHADFNASPLETGNYDKATSMQLSYTQGVEHNLSIFIAQSRGEAEGNPEEFCNSLMSQPAGVSCEVTQYQGRPVITSLVICAPATKSPGPRVWEMLPLASKEAIAVTGTDGLYFRRTVKVERSDTLVTTAQEVVRADTLDEAEQRFASPPDTLLEVANDPRLTIPLPGTHD